MKRELSKKERDLIVAALSREIANTAELFTIINLDKDKKSAKELQDKMRQLNNSAILFANDDLKLWIETRDDGSYMADAMRQEGKP